LWTKRQLINGTGSGPAPPPQCQWWQWNCKGVVDNVVNWADQKKAAIAGTAVALAIGSACTITLDPRGRAVEMYVALKPGLAPGAGIADQGRRGDRRDRENRPTRQRLDRPGHAQDPLREDHA
jgi:hypothetical protein